MAHSHCTGMETGLGLELGTGTGTGPGTGTGTGPGTGTGLGLKIRPRNIMHATENHYKVLQGNSSGPEKWVGNPLTNFQVPAPVPAVPVQCEQFCNILSPIVPSPGPCPGPVLCERALIAITLYGRMIQIVMPNACNFSMKFDTSAVSSLKAIRQFSFYIKMKKKISFNDHNKPE